MDSEELFPTEKESEVFDMYDDEESPEDDIRLGMIMPMRVRDPSVIKFQRIGRLEKQINTIEDLQTCIEKTEQRLMMEHENIVQMLDYCYRPLDDQPDSFYFASFYELCQTHLEDEVQLRNEQDRRFTDLEIYHLIKEITQALAYLQDNHLIHGDLR